MTEARDGLLRVVTVRSPLLLRLEGEADLSNRDLLSAALRAMTAPGTSDLHVDLGRLAFIDVGGLLLLRRAEQALARQGRRLRMHGVPPVARKAMRLLDWETPAVEGATP
ncbi:STAS domain-containing protein [Actinomadura sp. NAK00032]|uniref:STAS domain-containing protein n=1 Tax=Actinomadura sp. NAK00032 TaxID=2742128 RepID=UPI00159135C5|nr:STAS domain-containing protein [Actinomadura sp. NAK00032]QKW35566.1 STAS domain-containing protein [Actinomadura sp. NAK00032]